MLVGVWCFALLALVSETECDEDGEENEDGYAADCGAYDEAGGWFRALRSRRCCSLRGRGIRKWCL